MHLHTTSHLGCCVSLCFKYWPWRNLWSLPSPRHHKHCICPFKGSSIICLSWSVDMPVSSSVVLPLAANCPPRRQGQGGPCIWGSFSITRHFNFGWYPLGSYSTPDTFLPLDFCSLFFSGCWHRAIKEGRRSASYQVRFNACRWYPQMVWAQGTRYRSSSYTHD